MRILKKSSGVEFVAGLRRLRGLLLVAALLGSSLLPVSVHAAPSAGYWWNPATPGTGFVIEVQGNIMFMAGFLYSANGNPTWVASTGPMASAAQYSGPLITYSGGQTLTGNYQGATQVSPALGTIAINFLTDTTATVTWPGGTVPIKRFDIVPGGSTASQPPTTPQAGWWWNPAEGGRGFALEVQGGQIYFAGYMYDNAGGATWYLATGAMTNSALYQGSWTALSGGQTLTGPYKAPTSQVPAGNVTLQFTSTSSANMTLPNGKQIVLNRFDFGVTGPTLAAFSPASAAPASLLAITGSGIDPSASLSLTFSDSTGFSVNVPLAAATANSLSVSIPPYYNVATGVFGNGVVNVKLTQSSAGQSADSNTLSGFAIKKLPTAPSGAGQSGQSTLSLIRANLSAAQKLQTSIKGTPQDTPAIQASIATQITDLQTLVANVQMVVQNGQSFTLGAVGGVNITVTSSNITDVDNLILATLQSLAAAPPGVLQSVGAESKAAEAAPTQGCLAAEALAFAQAVASGTTGAALDALALALVTAPSVSAACGTVAGFTSAYQIFGGSGNIGLGIANAAGNVAVASKLPGAALFSTANANANIAVGLSALLAPALATQSAAVQSAISGVTVLAQPATNELLAQATGIIATTLKNSQTFITTVAPASGGTGVPTNLPTGTYNFTFTVSETNPGGNLNETVGPIPLTNADAAVFAAAIQSNINSFNATTCNNSGITCSAVYTPFNGTTFSVTFTISGPGTTGVITYTITKTG